MAGVLSAALIAIIITEHFDDGDRWHRFAIFVSSTILVCLILIILGVAFYPLTGNWAVFLHWFAIILSVLIISILLVNYFAQSDEKDEDTRWLFLIAICFDMLIFFTLWLLGLH